MNNTVTITMPEWKHRRLLDRIETLKGAVRLFKINEAFRKTYVDDIFCIEGILKQSTNHGGKGQ